MKRTACLDLSRLYHFIKLKKKTLFCEGGAEICVSVFLLLQASPQLSCLFAVSLWSNEEFVRAPPARIAG